MTESRRPWWHMAGSAKQGFVLGAFWGFLAVAQFIVLGAGDGGWLSIVLGTGAAVLSATYLATALALRRR
ncbi:hypothetical protein JIG36_47755 [Actinoplanes sp. LDG1-06]|uniref:Uncharacterized protein n=1 Tax=Paractinoplanes ovalisporus TaxID=2810368 RepID=A0ABS2ATL6_9ACTN|nr:hypothetical protein [Actinoplanes ovalisporus]MBM2623218.1 hypothetical protein [Actinoplanes ovalisporus]